jgi:hypothetical protein
VSLTREITKSSSSTTSAAWHSSNTASSTATLPPTTCDCITDAFATDSGWLVHVFWSKVLIFHSLFSQVILCNFLISPITGKMEESDPLPPPPNKGGFKGKRVRF